MKSISTILSSIRIRAATATDLPAIEDLLTSSDLPTAGVREALPGFLVAESDARIIGVVGLEHCGGYGLLRSTAVAAEWRGRHVARQLVERIIAAAEAQGIRALYLLTTTAERYFPTFGFEVTSRDGAPAEIKATGEFREACPASATVMCLPLSRARVAARE
ncbi:MAG TPA: arsenic resistance N-acetyltransferase ArsN2 [Gemmatimonadaceae bacterium]|nr:arsenic resistance N-acetyltransferase ArsN2 [Gemmatimonadaceae bacterium]